MANGIIKQVKIAGTTDPYDISALYIQGDNANKTWQDIKDLVSTSFEIKGPVTTLPTVSTPSDYDTYKNCILLCNNGETPETGTYIEWVIVKGGTETTPTYTWEKIGTSATDLSEYAKKAVAGKAGTYTTTDKAAFNTGWATSTTSSVSNSGGQTATGTATVTIPKASFPTATGSGGDSEEADTGTGGGVTISGSNFTFTGTTATLSQAAGTGTVKIDDHSYTPAGSIGGSQALGNHSHTIGGTTSTATFMTSATLSTAGGHSHTVDSHTHAANQTVLTGVKPTGSTNVVTGLTTVGISVTSNVLSLPSVVATGGSTGSAITGVGANGTASVAGAPSSATLTTSEVAAHSHTVNKATASFSYISALNANTGNASGGTVNGSNFTFTGTAATLKHTQANTTAGTFATLNTSVPAVSISYQPAGTIGGSQAVAAHSHKYQKPKNHTHSVTFSSITVSGTASVAVSSHTHTVTMASHSHSIAAHNHQVTVPTIS